MLGLFSGRRLGRGSDRAWQTGRRVAAVRRGHRPALEGLEERIALATDTWTGGAGLSDTGWMNPNNWQGLAAPVAGDDLVFPANPKSQINNNNFLAGTNFNSITIQAANYTLTGNSLSLNTGITASYTTGTSTYAIATTLDAVVAPIAVGSGGTLDVNAALSGSAGVNVTGGGALDLMQVNTYTGATTIASATILIVDGTIGGVQNSGSRLTGNGSVGAVGSVAGEIFPGHLGTSTTAATPGQLTANGAVTLDSSSTLAALLDGNVVGNGSTGYSQLVVNSGTVNLGSAALAAVLGTSYTPAIGDQLTIIKNNAGNAINGTFANLPEGATVTASGKVFRISYVGGNGHDVVLTAVPATSTTLTSSSSPASTVGQPVTFTATVASTTPGAGLPMGTVSFSIDGTTVLPPVPLNAATGQASYTTSSLGIGSHQVVATFNANPPFQGSTSNTLTQSISTAGTLPVVTLVPVRNRHGKVLKFDVVVQVEPSNAGLGTPTGSVSYFINGRAFSQIVPLTDGVAVLPQLRQRLVNHYVYARYNGSSGFLASASPQLYVSYRDLVLLSRRAVTQGEPSDRLSRGRRGS